MAKRAPRILVEGIVLDKYVKAWKEGRDYAVQVWHNKTGEGEPDGDWGMPSILGLSGSIEQSIIQTPEKKQ